MNWRRKKREVQTPEPMCPQGVRIERADGTVVPAELVYEGVVNRLHRWQVAGVVVGEGDALVCDLLPAKTTLAVTWREEEWDLGDE